MTPVSIAEAASTIDSVRRLALWKEPRGGTLLEVIAGPAQKYPELPALFLSPDGRLAEPLSWSALWSGALAQASG